MRIERVKERFGYLGEFIIKLEADPGGKKSERLDHPLNVRILYLFLVEEQPSGDLRVSPCELCTHTP